MYSVTSEAPASVSFPTAPPKAARSDPSPGTDSFGALVDSSAHSDTGNDRTASAAQQQYAPQRRAGDAAASNDNTQSRDAAPVDQSTRNNSDDRDAAARQVSDRNADANRDAVQRSQAKSRALKAGIAKSAEKPASDKTSDSSEVPAATTPQGDPPATTSNAVAVAIPVTIASADVPAATPASGDAAAPLAIAAAAMTAGSPVAAAPAVSIAQIKIDSDVAATADTASEAAIADTAAAAATAKVAIGAAASEAVTTPVKPNSDRCTGGNRCSLDCGCRSDVTRYIEIRTSKVSSRVTSESRFIGVLGFGHIGATRNRHTDRGGAEQPRATTGRRGQAGGRQQYCRHGENRCFRKFLISDCCGS